MGAPMHSSVRGPVVLHGDLTCAAVPAIRQALLAAVSAPQARQVVVDLSRVTFLDCAAVGALIFGRNAATALEVPYCVVGATGQARYLLGLLGLLEVLERPSRPVPRQRRPGWSPGDPGGYPVAPAAVPAPRPARPVPPPSGYRHGDPGEPG